MTRQRQRYLLVASVITLGLTFSVFEFNNVSIGGSVGTIDISSTHLAWVLACADIYLLALFLVGATHENRLHKLQTDYFDKQSEGMRKEFAARVDKSVAFLLQEHELNSRQHARVMSELAS